MNVVLKSVGDRQIEVIKEIRPVTGLGLKEAKDLAGGAPKPIQTGRSRTPAPKWPSSQWPPHEVPSVPQGDEAFGEDQSLSFRASKA